MSYPIPRRNKYKNLVLKFEKIKFDHESHGTRTREKLRWLGPARAVNFKPVPSSEKAALNNKPATV
jgi:hypothetical protein